MSFDNDALKADLMRDEGLRRSTYKCTAGVLTIGYGHTSGVREGQTCTQDQAVAWLRQDIASAVADLDRSLPWWRKLPPGPARGLANMAFNIGINRLLGFKRMLQALSVQNWAMAANEALNSKWADQVGNRAGRIANLFRGG